ncbi:MAG: CoA ester lyase [Caldilineaceae bacterium]|nr:CoA ester lyase [Caldilineaceae bacterium]
MTDPNQSSPRRSLLYVPGDSLRKIAKASTLPADTLILDLEDGVALSQKEPARHTVRQALRELDFGPRERLVRINDVNGPLAQSDLALTIEARPAGYVIPKVESAADLLAVSHFIDEQEKLRGWPLGQIRLLAMLETARGIMNLREISQATPRLDALIFGAEDFAATIGAVRTRENSELFYARSALVTAAGAYQLQAIDLVFVGLADPEGLEAECIQGRNLGFIGKTVIHPSQIEIANRLFGPTEAEVEAARRLVAAFAEHQAAGTGAFAYDGKMVDMPVIRLAQRLLARTEAIANRR